MLDWSGAPWFGKERAWASTGDRLTAFVYYDLATFGAEFELIKFMKVLA